MSLPPEVPEFDAPDVKHGWKSPEAQILLTSIEHGGHLGCDFQYRVIPPQRSAIPSTFTCAATKERTAFINGTHDATRATMVCCSLLASPEVNAIASGSTLLPNVASK